MQVPVTALYASILAIFATLLSFHAGGFRGKIGISILFGEPVNLELAQRVRVHQNFLEYVPLVLILMIALELVGGSATFLHIVGIALIISRVAHAVGLKHDRMMHPGRIIGAGGTALVTLATALYTLWLVGKPMLG